MSEHLVGVLLPSVVGLLFLGIGLRIVAPARERRARARRLDDTERVPVGDRETGTVAVGGTAGPTAETTLRRSPIGETEALVSYARIERYQGGSWTTLHEERHAEPLTVDDGTGEARVELPAEAALELDETRTTVDIDEEPPASIRRFLDTVADVDESTPREFGPLTFGDRRRYSEGVVAPGRQLTVLGSAREGRVGHDERAYLLDEPTPDGEFVLSDRPIDDVTEEYRRGVRAQFAVGGVFAAVGVLLFTVPLLAG